MTDCDCIDTTHSL